MSNQEREEQLLYEMMPHVATQMRLSLAGIYVAAARLAPAEERARDPELDKNAAMLLQGYFRLLRLANELDAAPLLASSAPLPTQNTELVEWVNSLVMEAQPLFELQGVKLSVQCALRSHVAAVHRPHLRRALWQLLGNALKYTEAGGTVTVTLQCQHQQVLIQVADTGAASSRSDWRMCSACICCPSVWRKAPAGWGWVCRWRGRWRSDTEAVCCWTARWGRGRA